MVKIAVIMTVKNEEKFIEKTLIHLQNQSLKPDQVVVVNDFSTDNTLKILEKFREKNGWVIKTKEKPEAKISHVVDSLTLASSLLKNDFDYLMVLDGDTFLEANYIEKLIQKFKSNPGLGIAGGYLRVPNLSKYKRKFISGDWNVWGSNRIYSKKCWVELNQMIKMNAQTPNWDTEHSVRAEARGYTVKRFDDIFSDAGKSGTSFKRGFNAGMREYQFGKSFLIVLIPSLVKLHPYRLAGFLSAWSKSKEKIDNPENMNKIKILHNVRFGSSIKKFFKSDKRC